MTVPEGIFISSIHVDESNVPLCDRDGISQPAHGKFKIWDHAKKEERRPVSVALNGVSTQTKLWVTICRNGEPSGVEYTLTGQFKNNKNTVPSFDSATFTLDDGDSIEIPINLNGYSHTVPWGVKDIIEWSFDSNNSTETPIELYAIAPAKILPICLKYKIPTELLEVFVLPAIRAGVTDYVKYAVAACHKSSEDEMACKTTTFGTFEPVHKYTYESIGGSPSFVPGLGRKPWPGVYNLSLWLENRGKKDKHLNCYDQAGLVQIVGSLGVLHESQKIDIYLLVPFGYISQTDLVGVGLCDNPFFRDHKFENYKTPVAPANPEKRRSGFRRHVFNIVGSLEEGKVLDACAGPEVGTKSLEEYMSHAIDAKAPHRLETDDKHKDTIDTADFAELELGDNIILKEGVTELGSSYHTDPAPPEDSAELKKIHEKGDVKKAIPDNEMFANFPKLINKLKSRSTISDDPTRSYMWDGTRLSWDSVGGKGTGVCIELQCHQNYEDAKNAWRNYFLLHPKLDVDDFETPADGTGKGDHHLLKTTSSGTRGLEAWVHSNVFVVVSNLVGAEDGEVESIANEIESFLSEAPRDPGEEHKMDDAVIKQLNPHITPGSEFEITVEVSGACDIQTKLEKHNILQIGKSVEGDLWKLKFLALHEGTESVTITITHSVTLRVASSKISVEVYAAENS